MSKIVLNLIFIFCGLRNFNLMKMRKGTSQTFKINDLLFENLIVFFFNIIK